MRTSVVDFRRRFGIVLYDWACKYVPELDKHRFEAPPDVAEAIAVEASTENVVVLTEIKPDLAWQPHQTGNVIMAEPIAVRNERLKRERGDQ